MKYLCTRKVVDVIDGIARTAPLLPSSPPHYTSPLGKPRVLDTTFEVQQRFCTYLASHIQGTLQKSLEKEGTQTLELSNCSPAMWWGLLDRLGKRVDSGYTSKIEIKEPVKGWAAHEEMCAIMHAGGFIGFPYIMHKLPNPHHPNDDNEERTTIQGSITFTFHDAQDCGIIMVKYHKRIYRHLAQSRPISPAGEAEERSGGVETPA
ncbi:hypothetical protein CYMTET_8618 [Cymbomonas tetramitiformis]|uniref:Uncharacterized protein n=2 Tax=Cymbomonas tetramitiformis TaxID=36881 RepID=A0AAE0F7W4_9CHLO|nr:hypothetical protein CYMTET_55887 [Cymbomonas tetramitiformis]KAK3242844.1 hypothetical protein CYMTET_47484 [Cymbomonas tetramitiformis]KAK3254635.1 hypothetical protein CYMTET_36155 [Cymbomonas tetramitiformis]KAK3283697.1 hypothetical protein CYMTET_8618 [Cymbomonas tetramitiformis]